jgi:hypothetical protein
MGAGGRVFSLISIAGHRLAAACSAWPLGGLGIMDRPLSCPPVGQALS